MQKALSTHRDTAKTTIGSAFNRITDCTKDHCIPIVLGSADFYAFDAEAQVKLMHLRAAMAISSMAIEAESFTIIVCMKSLGVFMKSRTSRVAELMSELAGIRMKDDKSFMNIDQIEGKRAYVTVNAFQVHGWLPVLDANAFRALRTSRALARALNITSNPSASEVCHNLAAVDLARLIVIPSSTSAGIIRQEFDLAIAEIDRVGVHRIETIELTSPRRGLFPLAITAEGERSMRHVVEA
jgi:hypothetical protein